MSGKEAGCDGLDGLVAWYPTGTLDEEERKRVEAHVSGCEACAQLLRLGEDIKGVLSQAQHPGAEAIVLFAEGGEALGREERERIQAHIAGCEQCGEQVELLAAVDRADHPERTTAPTRPRPSWAGRVWRRLGHSVLSPVPAAAYLLIAVVVAGAYFVSRGGGSTPGVGVVIVPDQGDRVRGANGAEVERTTIDRSSPRLLLFELTRLESPPNADAQYAVSITSAGTGETAVQFDVEGRTFLDNYTIGYVLQPGTLEPGRYTVEIVSPVGEVLFQSILDVR